MILLDVVTNCFHCMWINTLLKWCLKILVKLFYFCWSQKGRESINIWNQTKVWVEFMFFPFSFLPQFQIIICPNVESLWVNSVFSLSKWGFLLVCFLQFFLGQLLPLYAATAANGVLPDCSPLLFFLLLLLLWNVNIRLMSLAIDVW